MKSNIFSCFSCTGLLRVAQGGAGLIRGWHREAQGGTGLHREA